MVSSYPNTRTSPRERQGSKPRHSPGLQPYRPDRRTAPNRRRSPVRFVPRVRPAPFGPGKVNGAQAARFALAGVKTVSKLNPYIRAGSFAYDVWNYYNNSAHQKTRPAGIDWTGWDLYRDCGVDGSVNRLANWTCGNVLRYVQLDQWEAAENFYVRSGNYTYGRTYRDLRTDLNPGYANMRQANIYRLYNPPPEPIKFPHYFRARLALPVLPDMVPEPWPLTLAPALQPINQPRQTPTAIPFEMIPQIKPNPNMPRQVQRQAGYTIATPRTWQLGDPIIFPGRPPKLTEIPMVMPPIVISNRPLPDQVPQLQMYHQKTRNGVRGRLPDPPDKKVKERKLKTNSGLNLALKIFSAGTEGKELIDIFYKNLPDEFKPRYVRPDGTVTYTAAKQPKLGDKLAALYKHWDKVDLPTSIRDVGNNIAEDAFYGSIGQLQAKANRQALGPFGHSRGPGLTYGKGHLRYLENEYRKTLED